MKLTLKKSSLHLSKWIPNKLQSMKLTSLRVQFVRLVELKLHSVNNSYACRTCKEYDAPDFIEKP